MIIGLVGFKQVGKSTAANYLAKKYGAVRLNMKDALVAEIKQNFPDLLNTIAITYGYDSIDGRVSKATIDELFVEKFPLVRALLQNYGTEVRRRDDPDYWVKRWKEAVGKFTAGAIVVVDDVRFQNEADAVISNNGILIRLTRDDITSGGDHASETEQVNIAVDRVINCKGGDEQALYDRLDRIMASLM